MGEKYKTGEKRVLAALVDFLVFVPLFVFEEHYVMTTNNLYLIGCWIFFISVASFLYSILLHFKYGQTLGKMIFKIKVMDVSERKIINLKQAFLRDSVWVAISIAGIIYFIVLATTKEQMTEKIKVNYDDFAGLIGLLWTLLELTTMLTNNKRRAIHDFIAQTVVVRT